MSNTILYIEDDMQHQRMLSKALTFRGYNVLQAADGHDGLEAAFNEQPDLILLDMLLPDLPGMEVYYRLRSDDATRHIPVVAVTASDNEDLREAAISQGFDGFLEKPLNTRTLDDSIQNFLAKNPVLY